MTKLSPLRIINSQTGAEYECASQDAFDAVYGDRPEWRVITPTAAETPVLLDDDGDEDAIEFDDETQESMSYETE